MKTHFTVTVPEGNTPEIIRDYLDLMSLDYTETHTPEAISSTKTYRLVIAQDGPHFDFDDPREADPENAPVKLYFVDCAYPSTLKNDLYAYENDVYAYDPTLRAYEHAVNELFMHREKAETFAQRFENIFGSGRKVELRGISGYSQGEWAYVLAVSEPGTDEKMIESYAKEFEAWWRNDYYMAELTEVTTTQWDDGTSSLDEREIDSMSGFLVIDFDWDWIVDEMVPQSVDRSLVEVVEPF